MLTDFGKIIRIIRINTGESLRDMAKKLDMSASYLSAIENGKRNLPPDICELIEKNYTLNESDLKKLKAAAITSIEKVKIDLTDLADKKKQMIMSLASDDIDDETLNKLCEIMSKKENA